MGHLGIMELSIIRGSPLSQPPPMAIYWGVGWGFLWHLSLSKPAREMQTLSQQTVKQPPLTAPLGKQRGSGRQTVPRVSATVWKYSKVFDPAQSLTPFLLGI